MAKGEIFGREAIILPGRRNSYFEASLGPSLIQQKGDAEALRRETLTLMPASTTTPR